MGILNNLKLFLKTRSEPNCIRILNQHIVQINCFILQLTIKRRRTVFLTNRKLAIQTYNYIMICRMLGCCNLSSAHGYHFHIMTYGWFYCQ